MKPGWEKTLDVELPPVLSDLDDEGKLRAGSVLKPKFAVAEASV